MTCLRIGIDARLSGKDHAGIGRYIEELVRGLVSQQTCHTFVIFLAKKNQLPWLSESEHVHIVYAPVRHYTVQEQVLMPFVFYKQHLDLLHIPHFNVPLLYRKPTVVTIHDLLWHHQKDKNATTLSPFMHAVKYDAYKYISESGISRAKQIIVPSQTVYDDVLRICHKESIVIPEGVNDVYFKKGKKTKRTYDFPFVMYTGSLYPHKNVSIVLSALKQLPTLHFLVSGSRSVFMDAFVGQVKSLGLQDRVHMLGYVEDEMLRELYQQAVALIQPSLSEGFGLTGIEAMASDCPVIASDIPILHEVYGSSCLYFDPHNERELCDRIKQCMRLPVRKKLIEFGNTTSEKYQWKDVITKTLSVYEKSV